MLYFDFCAEVFGKPARYLVADPVLPKRSLNKYPCRYDKKQQRQEGPQQYFFEFPQVQ